MTATRTKKSRTQYLAVSGENDRSFDKYTDACEWLDRISPETATAGFTTEIMEESEERTLIAVRHAG